MNLKPLMLGALLAVTGIAPTHADDFATVVTLTPSGGSPVNYSGGFNVTHLDAGAFTDTYTFTPDVAGLVSASLVTVATNASTDIDFTTATINGQTFAPSPNGSFEVRFFAPQTLSGPLMLLVGGVAAPTLAPGTSVTASYAGTINVTPVSEPQTYALFVAGLGVLGLLLRKCA